MDYEKAYKEALERAKEMSALPDDRVTMEYIFHELKENEDEEARKYLLHCVEEWEEGHCCWNSNKEAIKPLKAYLERQKPSISIATLTWKDIENIQDLIDQVRSENSNGIGAKCLYTDVLERFIDGKGISIKRKPVENNYPAYNPNEYESFEDGNATGLRKKQKDVGWSEKDEEIISFLNALCIDAQNPNNCASYSMYYKEVEKAKDWLKSIKERLKGE